MRNTIIMVLVALIFTIRTANAKQPEPLTLEQCVLMAMEYNPRIKTAGAKISEMNAAVKEASAANYPKLSGQAAYTRLIPQPTANVPVGVDMVTGQQQFGGAFAPVVTREFETSGNAYTAGLTLTQTLYTGGKIKNSQKISEHNRNAAQWQKESTVREIRRDVTKAYYQALAASKGIEALDSAIALMEIMLKDLNAAVDLGMRGEHELLQAQLQLANQKLARQQAETGAKMALNYLSTLIGVPVDTPITIYYISGYGNRSVIQFYLSCGQGVHRCRGSFCGCKPVKQCSCFGMRERGGGGGSC